MKKYIFTITAVLLFNLPAFSLTTIKGMPLAYIQSANSDNLQKWYRDKLGVDIVGVPEVPGWKELRFKTSSGFGIQAFKEPRTGSQKQAQMIAFQVDNIDQAVNDFTRAGVKFEVPVGKLTPIFDRGPVKMAVFQDLDGNYLQLMQLPK